MNRMIKVGVAALAMAVVVPSFAEELETRDEGAVGWTPFAIGLVSPVQLPWGHCRWDVYGVDFGILYYGSAKTYGLGFAGLGGYSRGESRGLFVSGAMNWCAKDVYGVRATLGANIAPNGTVRGVEAGGFGYRKAMWGLDMNFVGSFQDEFWGWQMAGLVNITKVQTYGLQSAIGVNIAEKAYGVQAAAIFNMAQELHGFQLGIVNFAETCPWGLQIGLVNIIMDNTIKVLPIFNCYF